MGTQDTYTALSDSDASSANLDSESKPPITAGGDYESLSVSYDTSLFPDGSDERLALVDFYQDHTFDLNGLNAGDSGVVILLEPFTRYAYAVTATGSTTTITFRGEDNSNMKEGEIEALVDALAYANTASAPTQSADRVFELQVTTEDGQAHAVRTSTVTVAPDEAAVFSGDVSSVGNEDEQQTGLLAATDGNGMGAPGYTVTVQPTNGSAYINEDTGSWVYIPDTDFHGDDAFTVGATDDAGNVYTQVVSLTVNSVDDPASFAGQTIFTAIESESITDTLTASDDSDGMSNPGYTISENPSQGTANIDPITGEWSYEPNDGYEGFDAFTVLATDDDGFTATQTISITVEPYVLDLDTNNADFNNEVIFPLGGEPVALATSEGNNVLSEDLTLLSPQVRLSRRGSTPFHSMRDRHGPNRQVIMPRNLCIIPAMARAKLGPCLRCIASRMLVVTTPSGCCGLLRLTGTIPTTTLTEETCTSLSKWSGSESRLTFYYGTTNAAGGYLQFDAPLETNGIDVNSAYWGYYVEYDGAHGYVHWKYCRCFQSI